MPRFAVVFVPEGEDPKIEILEGVTWREAAFQHRLQPWDTLDAVEEEDIDVGVPLTYDEATEDALNRGTLFAYILIP